MPLASYDLSDLKRSLNRWSYKINKSPIVTIICIMQVLACLSATPMIEGQGEITLKHENIEDGGLIIVFRISESNTELYREILYILCLSVCLFVCLFPWTSKLLNRLGPNFLWDLTGPRGGLRMIEFQKNCIWQNSIFIKLNIL